MPNNESAEFAMQWSRIHSAAAAAEGSYLLQSRGGALCKDEGWSLVALSLLNEKTKACASW